jgi:hypothetical protein
MTTDNVRIHLLPNRPSLAGVPPDIAAGFATASGLLVCTHWQRAVTALKIAADPTTGGPTHVSYDDLGAVAEVIDNIDATTAWSSPDVQLLEKLRQQRPWVTGLLDGILSHSSMREVARVQHLHHSTLQQRFDWLQNQIGYTVLSPSGYARASTALVLWRLARASKNKTKPVPSTMEDAEPPIGG